MRKTKSNLWGALPPEALPTSCTLQGRDQVGVYESCGAPGGQWHKEPFKLNAQEWNQLKPTIWIEYTRDENQALLNGKPLSLAESLQVVNHSPSGFNWGYGRSGPAQLALAICAKLYGVPLGKKVYQQFKRWFIAPLPNGEDFETRIGLEEFNSKVLIPAMEELKSDLLLAIDEAKASIEFLEWLPSNAENVSEDGEFGELTNYNY